MSKLEPETIRYTADVVCVRGNEVLLIERGHSPHKGKLALPGGHVDRGETSLAAAVRELAEETGVHVDVDDMTSVGVYDDPDRDPRGRYVTVVYLVRVPADTVAVAGDDAAALQWHKFTDVTQVAYRDRIAFDHWLVLHDARWLWMSGVGR